MLMKSRTFGYAILAAGLMAAASPAFAAAGGGGGDGGNPSITSGSASPTANNMPTNSPAGSMSNPQHATSSSRRTAQNTTTHLKAPSSMGEGTAGTPNSHPALAPSNAVQTNNPMGSK